MRRAVCFALNAVAHFSIFRCAAHGLLSFCLLGLAISGAAQQLPSRIQGAYDSEIQVPVSDQKPLGYSDASALAELVAYTVAVGGSAWTGLTASGNISFGGATDTMPASLLMLPGNRVKLDVTKPEGHEITVYNGVRGSITHADSKKTLLAPKGAASGLAPFDIPLNAAKAGLGFSIVDRGSTVVQDRVLHRISIEVAIPQKDLFPYEKDNRSVVDLYFDPSTHLLVKTACMIPIPGSSLPVLLKIDSYSAYQRVGTLLLPTTIDETINGQPVSKLVLTSFNANNMPSSKDFTF